MNVKMPGCPRLPETPTLGRRYPRPCVRTEWHGSGRKWIPVLGTVHDDAEHIRADFQHIQVDYRFLCQRDRQRSLLQARVDERLDGVNPIFILPISAVVPADTEEPITIDEAIRTNHPIDEWLSVRKRPYQGPYPDYPQVSRTGWRSAPQPRTRTTN